MHGSKQGSATWSQDEEAAYQRWKRNLFESIEALQTAAFLDFDLETHEACSTVLRYLEGNR